MRTLLLIFVALLSAAFSPVPMLPDPPAADALVGRWLTADKRGIVQISGPPSGPYGGKIVGPLTPPRLDANNPDPALRRRPLLGVALLQGFRYAEGAWTGGTIYDPNNGKTYSCTLRLPSANALEVRGYVGLSLFGRTETWTRLP